jgi:hypothetical protein
MEITKSKETTDRPSDDGSSLGPGWGGPSSNEIANSMLDPIIVHAWSLKSAMRWVRDDRSPLNSFRWFVWDWFGIGDPPSTVERTAAGEITTVTADSVPVLPNRRLLKAV